MVVERVCCCAGQQQCLASTCSVRRRGRVAMRCDPMGVVKAQKTDASKRPGRCKRRCRPAALCQRTGFNVDPCGQRRGVACTLRVRVARRCDAAGLFKGRLCPATTMRYTVLSVCVWHVASESPLHWRVALPSCRPIFLGVGTMCGVRQEKGQAHTARLRVWKHLWRVPTFIPLDWTPRTAPQYSTPQTDLSQPTLVCCHPALPGLTSQPPASGTPPPRSRSAH